MGLHVTNASTLAVNFNIDVYEQKYHQLKIKTGWMRLFPAVSRDAGRVIYLFIRVIYLFMRYECQSVFAEETRIYY